MYAIPVKVDKERIILERRGNEPSGFKLRSGRGMW
jgi:hypothetical protein